MALRKVKVKQGWLSGVAGNDPAISVFKGVPYAKPPVGELRWRAPQPPEPWEGVRNAHVFSAKCMQRGQMKGSFYQKEYYPVDEPISEDSLYLNIWTPAESADEKLPVYFWIHGGGFTGGYGYSAHFGGGGEGFGRHGVILVTINYRLGVWGFLANKELSEEAPYKSSGNYGLLDMIAALQWVRENIAAFGGDPDNITIGGQSAGAMAVQALCNSPLTKGMFAKAILESGGGINLAAGLSRQMTLEDAEKVTDLKAVFGVDTIAEARALPAEEIQARLNGFGMRDGPRMVTAPIVDGYVLTKNNVTAARTGEFHDVDYLIGHTGDETIGSINARTVDGFEAAIKANLGESAEAMLAQCDLANFDTFGKAYAREQQDCIYSAWGDMLEKHGRKPGYVYNFTRRPPGDEAGAFHAVDLMYVFQTFVRSWRPMTGLDYEISRDMLKYWCNFIKTGDPNGEGLPKWDAYTSETPYIMEIGDKIGEYRHEDTERGKIYKAELFK